MTERVFAIPCAIVPSSGAPDLRLAIDVAELNEAERGRLMSDLARTAPHNTLVGALRAFALEGSSGLPLKDYLHNRAIAGSVRNK